MTSKPDWHYALVEVRWSGKKYSAGPDEKRKKMSDSALFRSLYVLARQRDAKTRAHQAVHSAHCENCGGAVSNSASPACEYCGAVLNTGEQQWILAGVFPVQSSDGRAWVNELKPPLPPPLPSSGGTPPPLPAKARSHRNDQNDRMIGSTISMV